MALSLVVANVKEFYRSLTVRLPDSSKTAWYRASEAVSGTAFFWGAGERRLVLPAPVEASLSEELSARLGAGDAKVLSPEEPTESLCDWLSERVGEAGEWIGAPRQRGFNLLAWGQTADLQGLIGGLAQNFGAPDHQYGNGESQVLVDQIDSKSGLRHLLTSGSPTTAGWMAEGYVAQNLSHAARLASESLEPWGGCVVKADRSAAGWGLVAFDGARRPRFPIYRHLARAARRMPELGRVPVVVERLLKNAGTVVSVSAQGMADGAGGSEFHFCAAHLDRAGAALVGRGVMDAAIEKRLEERFADVSAYLSSLGYRGIMGVDFALDSGGEPRILEVNPRRTTLTAAFEGAGRLGLAEGGRNYCVLFRPSVAGAGRWAKLPAPARRLLWPDERSGIGWLPVPAPCFGGGRQDWSGALFFARDASLAEELADELACALR